METTRSTHHSRQSLSVTLAAVLFPLSALVPAVNASNPIWINPWTCGTPIQTYYLGDSLASPWYVNFEIGQESWDYAQVGYGTSSSGTGFNWGTAYWYENGDGSNRRVRRDIGGLKFTSAGNWYWICQAKESPGDTYTSASACGWVSSTTYPPSPLSYFTVNALNPPLGQSATPASASQIDLAWTKGASGNAKDTLILRSTSPTFTDPTQGTSYSVGNTIGGATVIYKGNSTSFPDTGLSGGTAYYYKFYAENYSYYSAGVTANACAVLAPPATTGASRCGSGSVALSASGSGGTLKWYSDSGLTTQVATGTSYNPTLSSTTTFYVTETSSAGCVSPASPVTGTVNPEPTGLSVNRNRFQGASLKIAISDLTSDTIQSVGTGSQSAAITWDSTYIYYVPQSGDNNNDSFTYTAANANCTKQGTISVTVLESTGQAQTIQVVAGKATVHFAGIPGYSYTVQRGENADFTGTVTPVLTTNLPTTGIGSDGLFMFEETASAEAYYRLKYNPLP